VTPELDRFLADDVAATIDQRPLEELRELRRRADEWETAVSLSRRVVHGRLDIVGHEQRRRAGDTDAVLLYDLPDILAEAGGGGGGRATRVGDPGPAAEAIGARVDAAAGPDVLCRIDQVDDAGLDDLARTLHHLERELSTARRSLHQRIDRLHAEIGRRYRDGEASVESLLG
jgi:hypothetical protein